MSKGYLDHTQKPAEKSTFDVSASKPDAALRPQPRLHWNPRRRRECAVRCPEVQIGTIPRDGARPASGLSTFHRSCQPVERAGWKR
jgi:hypothetical protein